VSERKRVRGLHTRRDRVLGETDLNEMFETLDRGYTNEHHPEDGFVYWQTHWDKKLQLERQAKVKVHINVPMARGLLAMFWLFGKRVYETIRLRARDIWCQDDGYLYARFTVQKKVPVNEQKAGVATHGPIVTKRVTLENPYTEYVVEYMKTITANDKDPEARVFPGGSMGKHVVQRHVKLKGRNPDGSTQEYEKTYEYVKDEIGILPAARAWQIVKALDEHAWTHLFRTSLATTMVEREHVTEEELVSWFDWSSIETAHRYVKGGTSTTEKLSKRTW